MGYSGRTAEAYTEITGSAALENANTVVAAPGAGRRIVWRKIKLVNTTANAMTVIVQYGSTSKMTSVFGADIGAGEIYYEECGVPLPENTALVLDLSAANAISFDVQYLTESV